MSTEKWAFVAGGFGFLGQYIVWGLLRRGYSVVIGATKRSTITLEQHLNQFVKYNSLVNPAFHLEVGDMKRINVVECDIGKPNLGLSAAAQTLVNQKSFAEVWNSAAYMKYDAKFYQKSYQTNVAGTRNLMQFTSTFSQCVYCHISTAFAGGRKFSHGKLFEERIYEDDGGFFNSYDTTKAQAEKEVVAYCSSHDILHTIFRPTIIIGDSTTGFTSSTFGFYEYLNAFNRLEKRIKGKNNRIIANGDSFLHIIPVDRCAEAILSLTQRAKMKKNSIYTIADKHPLTNRQMLDLFSELFNTSFSCIKSPASDETNRERLLRKFTARNQIFSLHSFNFSSTNTHSTIDQSICSDWPKNRDYFCMINEYFNQLNSTNPQT
ncbi:MAG: NAD-dependent epimerase/dehydratase family protein, partial [Candidatus Electrothrix sp. AR4]|nr:NAD-dependent epimerase/dehydratase family protein [Candidatus Electrothrix sp. AR4]